MAPAACSATALALLLGGLAYAGITWGLPDRKADAVITAKATRGDLIITVTDRGELESAKSDQVNCEVEGGGKIATIVPEGTRVKKGDEVCRFDTDTLQKAINEQSVKWEQAVSKAKAARSELEVQKNKELSEIDKADLALILAKIDLESYTDKKGEYQVEVDKRQGAIELAKKELKESEDNLEFTRGLVKKGFAQLEQLPALELAVESKQFTAKEKLADLHVFEKFTSQKKRVELKAKAKDADRELDRTKKSQSAATEKAANEVKAATKTAELEEQHLKRFQAQMEKCIVKAPSGGDRHLLQPAVLGRVVAHPARGERLLSAADLHPPRPGRHAGEDEGPRVGRQKGAQRHDRHHADGSPLRAGAARQGEVGRHPRLERRGWGGGVKEYETVITIDDLPSEAGLRPGMTAEAKILIKTIPNALTVPVSAVTESDGKHICYVKTGRGLERREVKIGEGNEQNIQILEGLEDGEEVALDARVRAAAEVKAGDDQDKEKKAAKEEKAPAQAPSPGPARK